MANTKSTEKRIRQTEVRRERNRGLRSAMRTTVKRLRQAVAEGDAKTASDLLPGALSLVDSTARKGGVHPNAAARTKARLTRAVRGIAG
jgi:small subunit ribosomal protein S20